MTWLSIQTCSFDFKIQIKMYVDIIFSLSHCGSWRRLNCIKSQGLVPQIFSTNHSFHLGHNFLIQLIYPSIFIAALQRIMEYGDDLSSWMPITLFCVCHYWRKELKSRHDGKRDYKYLQPKYYILVS